MVRNKVHMLAVCEAVMVEYTYSNSKDILYPSYI
jgi:hypothetical protein